MKVLMLNSSPHSAGSTAHTLEHMAEIFSQNGVEWEIFSMSAEPLRDCIGCLQCRKNEGRCVFDGDDVNRFIEKAKSADAFVFATPVYYAHPSGRILSLLDRVFYANSEAFRHKPAAAVAIARRAGTTASVDVLNKYFTFAQMPVVSSTYWNVVHGQKDDQVLQDLEGMQTVENLARNMVWLMQCIEAGKSEGILPPENPKAARTNFIR